MVQQLNQSLKIKELQETEVQECLGVAKTSFLLSRIPKNLLKNLSYHGP
jgi:hypothetical protein